MDSRIGLDYIVENKEYTAKLGSGVKVLYFLFFFWHTIINLQRGVKKGCSIFVLFKTCKLVAVGGQLFFAH